MKQGRVVKREPVPLAISAIGERFQGLRIVDPSAERTILNSMRQYGQLTPVVVCRFEPQDRDELLDALGKVRAGLLRVDEELRHLENREQVMVEVSNSREDFERNTWW